MFLHVKSSIFLFACILATLVVYVESSIAPHRLFPLETPLARASISSRAHDHPLNRSSDVPGYMLSIIEGDSLNVGLNITSSITLNLNRGLDQDVAINISVFSGPELIEFDQETKNLSNPKTSIIVTYKANTFGDKIVEFHTQDQAGHAEIVCRVKPLKNNVTIDDSRSYISVNIHRFWNLTILIHIVGWIYFVAWSASFYFQIILNYQRKSVIGLNFDFIALNILGFTYYSIYNSALLFSYPVQSVYYSRYTYTRIPVEYNDLFFSLHALLMSTITLIQCFIYERGEQKVSIPTGIFVAIASVLGFCLYIASLFQSITILDVVLYLSHVKLVITIIKYTPQAFMNYQRKATTGWSIHNILLDFTGGAFSLGQMFLIAYNYNDWIAIFGNFTKFGLAVISISFDILFIVQHYILYNRADGLEDLVERLNPVISESIRSASYAPQQQQPPTPGLRNEARFTPHSDNGGSLRRPQDEGTDNDNFDSDED